MIRHICMFSVDKKLSLEERLAAAKKIGEMNKALVAEVPELKAVEYNLSCNEANEYELFMYADYDNLEGLAAYKKSAGHDRLMEYVKTVKDKSVVFDYNI